MSLICRGFLNVFSKKPNGGQWIGSYETKSELSLRVEFYVSLNLSSDKHAVEGTFRHYTSEVSSLPIGERHGNKLEFQVAHAAPRAVGGMVHVAFKGNYSDRGDIADGSWEILDGFFAGRKGPWIMYLEGGEALKRVGFHQIETGTYYFED